MRRSRITFLIGIMLSLSYLGQSNNFYQEEAIPVTDEPSRHVLQLDQNTSVLFLNDLKPGERYLAFVESRESNCPVSFTQADEKHPGALEFVAEATNQQLDLSYSCTESLVIDFSIACISCNTKKNTSKSMMGIMTDNLITPQELVEDVLIAGECFDVDASSITYSGDEDGRGYFSSGTNSINIEEGIILSTGNIQSAEGPNNSYNTGNTFFNFDEELDLEQMVNSTSLYDVGVLEFDFTPTSNQISFEFVFASEEYCEYATSSFNDAFGFFISGPGINGPFTNGAENIAIVPGTNSNASINSINHVTNPAYYVNNVPLGQLGNLPPHLQCPGYPSDQGVAIDEIEYDGFTTVISATANVQACETYHIKLVIADVTDAYYDSAVFLKANSFGGGEVADVYTDAQGGVDADIAYENCEPGYFVFERPDEDLSEDLVVNFEVSDLSTATAGIDYEWLPNSITIPAGDSIYYLPVTTYYDNFAEGIETIRLDLDAPCSCEQPYVLMFIEDVEPLAVVAEDLFFCDPVANSITPDYTGGLGNYTFLWNTGDTTATLDFYTENDVLYTVTVSDECGNTIEESIQIDIIQSPTATLSGGGLVCPDNPTTDLIITFTGDGPWEIIYSIDNVSQNPISGIVDNPLIIAGTAIGNYQIESVSNIGCDGEVFGNALIDEVSWDVTFDTNDESCPGVADGSITVIATGANEPLSYAWDNGIGNVQNPSGLIPGFYNLTITDANGCTYEDQVEIGLNPDVPEASAGTDQTLTCEFSELSLNGNASSGAMFSYLWTTDDGNILSGETTLSPMIDQIGVYTLHVTNTMTNCTVIDKTEVFIDTIAPTAAVDIIGPISLNCTDTLTVLDAFASMPQGQINFEWTTNDGNILSGANTFNPEVNAGGTYQLVVTNIVNGCTDTESIVIGSNITLPTIEIIPPGPLTCIDSIQVIDGGASSTGANYSILWTSGDGNFVEGINTLFPTVDQPGNYELTIFNTSNNCSNTASVQVAEDREAPIADAGLPTEFDCNDESVSLDGSASSLGDFFIYQWFTNNGEIISETDALYPEVSMPGNYTLLVTNTRNGCTATDMALVFQDPNVPTAMDVEVYDPLCFGDEGAIAIPAVVGGEGPYLYSINNGVDFYNQNLFTGLQPGNYTVVVQDAEGCLLENEYTVIAAQEIIIGTAPDTTIEFGDTYNLDAVVNLPAFSLDSIIWTPMATLDCTDCLDPLAFPLESTLYQLMIIDENGCTQDAEVLVRVDKDRNIFIPNAFSPNGDGLNDRFMIYAKEGIVTNISNFQVFDRWGGKVYEGRDGMANDNGFGWDGQVKGTFGNPGVYVYYAEIEFIDGAKLIYKGDVTVVE